MSEYLKEYKCPNCGGILVFDSASQKLKCPYCSSEFDVDAIEQYNQDVLDSVDSDLDFQSKVGSNWSDAELEHIHEYICKSCGGDIITDETTAAASCPYCGNPVVMLDRVEGALRPDLVVPFKLDKEEAMRRYRKHVSGKPLAPKAFKDQAHIAEIKGVYVPFWLYDADVSARARYMATTTHSWSDATYDYTEVRHYSVYRAGRIGFDNVPSNGSSKVDSTLMESIEPFDMSEAVDFKTAYLAGYFADKFDISAAESSKAANERMRRSTESAINSTIVGYSSVTPNGMNLNLLDERVKYCLLPVWLLVTTYNREKYIFAMNGQTGRFVGDLPTDKGAYWRYFITIALAVSVGYFILSYLFKLF